MKTFRLLFSLWVGLLIPLVWAGCDTVREASRPSVPPVKVSGIYQGQAVVKTIDAKRIIVALDETSDHGAPDGQVDHVFTLQLEQPLPTPIEWSATPATLYHAKGNLYIRSTAGSLHLRTAGFDLAEAERTRMLTAGEAVVAGQIQALTWSSPVEGVGLAHQLVEEGAPFSLEEASRAEAYLAADDGACAPSISFRAGLRSLSSTAAKQLGICELNMCDSGGQGSTSCSVERCSVSCSTGYHACCSNAGVCKCCASSDEEVGGKPRSQ